MTKILRYFCLSYYVSSDKKAKYLALLVIMYLTQNSYVLGQSTSSLFFLEQGTGILFGRKYITNRSTFLLRRGGKILLVNEALVFSINVCCHSFRIKGKR